MSKILTDRALLAQALKAFRKCVPMDGKHAEVDAVFKSLRDALFQEGQCTEESDCTGMPWCRIRNECQRAAPAQQEIDWSLLEATQSSLREHMAEIRRLRAALEQALKTIESWNPSLRTDDDEAAITALRAALAEPDIDPVDEYRKGFIAGQIDMRDRPAEPETPCRRAICQRGPDGYCAPCHERMYP